MAELSNNIYAAFGVFGFIIIGMGVVINYLVNEKKQIHEENAKSNEASTEAIKDVTKALTSFEILIKTIKF